MAGYSGELLIGMPRQCSRLKNVHSDLVESGGSFCYILSQFLLVFSFSKRLKTAPNAKCVFLPRYVSQFIEYVSYGDMICASQVVQNSQRASFLKEINMISKPLVPQKLLYGRLDIRYPARVRIVYDFLYQCVIIKSDDVHSQKYE